MRGKRKAIDHADHRMIRVIDNTTTAGRGPRLLYPQGQQAQPPADPDLGLLEQQRRRDHHHPHHQEQHPAPRQ